MNVKHTLCYINYIGSKIYYKLVKHTLIVSSTKRRKVGFIKKNVVFDMKRLTNSSLVKLELNKNIVQVKQVFFCKIILMIFFFYLYFRLLLKRVLFILSTTIYLKLTLTRNKKSISNLKNSEILLLILNRFERT